MLNGMLGDGKLIYAKYSMGLWEKGAANLEQWQMQMIDDVIEKLDIQDGDRILDFGGGWGCVPTYILAKLPNVQFTGINLSYHQCEYMRLKMQDPESYLSSGRFTLYEGDLNDAQFETKFDKILFLGVFCHVRHLTQAFQNSPLFSKIRAAFSFRSSKFPPLTIYPACSPTNTFSPTAVTGNTMFQPQQKPQNHKKLVSQRIPLLYNLC
jgi:cyclopropane-fatty-acyl-phospholipid synthase